MIEELEQVFRKVFANNSLTITVATSAKDISMWDSLTHLELIDAVEHKFRIRFTFDEVMHFNNVGDMLKIIERKVRDKKSGR